MIYSAWYFCNEAKLSIIETKRMLKVVWALDYAETDFAEKCKAVNSLEEYDSLVQSYLIPCLVACLFSSDSRKEIDEIPDSPEKRQYIQKITDLLMNLSPEHKQQSLVNMIQSLQDVDYDYAVKYAAAYKSDERTLQDGNNHYLDGERFFREIFLLSILRCVSRKNASMVLELVRGEEQIELLQQALAGCFGQLCWNIAAEIQLRCGVSVYEVIRFLPENWQERPDMVELIVPFLFPEDDGRDSVQEIMEETYRLNRFRRYWAKQTETRNGSWMSPNATKEEHTRLCIVLWQGILWNLAMDRNAGRCAELLRDSWETPNFYTGKINSRLHLNIYQYWMIPERIGIDKEERIRQYVCSPWQERTEELWNKGRGKKVAGEHTEEELFHEFRSFIHNDNGLKVFMAACLTSRLFIIQRDNIDDFYIRLLLHFGDLFSSYGVRNTFQQVTSPPIDGIRVAAWEPSIRALGCFACDLVKNIGMGIVNSSVPEKIITHLSRRSPLVSRHADYKNKQLDCLYKFSAFFVAAYWAYESLSTTSISRCGMENMWLKNGRESSAARICGWIFKYLHRQAVNERNAIQLDVQAFDSAFSGHTENKFPAWLKNMQTGKVPKVRFTQLILARNLTYKEWYSVGEITRERFDKDAYLIAHTLRIRTLLESEYSASGHDWISEWKNTISDISHKWEFSRMARYIMVQMFTTVPGREENYSILVDLLKKIIYMVQEFASLDSVYYLYRLSESLIELPVELGEETGNDLRGINAVELFCNMERFAAVSENSYIWEDLFLYYLLTISDSSKPDSERYAGKQLIRYWKNKKAGRNHLRTELIKTDDWSEWTDRIWQVKDGKLLVVRDSLDISGTAMTGVIAEARKEVDDTYQYVIYSGEEQKTFDRVPERHRKGEIVEVQVDDCHLIEKFSAARWKPEKGEQVLAKFEITADVLRILVMGTSFEEEYEEAPELFNLWNGDFGELFSHGHQLKGTTTVEYTEYRAGHWGWGPLAGSYSEFLVRRIFLPENVKRKCTLTFLGQTKNAKELLFSARAGENYILADQNWTPDSWKKIEEELLGEKKREGIRVRLFLRNINGFPYLELDGDEPWDYRNILWREQFTDKQPLQIWNENKKWITKTDVKEIRKEIAVRLKDGMRYLKPDNRHNMQVAEDGWNEVNQRKGWLMVEGLKSSVLDYRMITYEELTRLINIKAGDVFKIKKVHLIKLVHGYYKTELDNKMTVYCAAESISLLAEIKDSCFWENRLCVVENVREWKNSAEERRAEPCNPTQLQGKKGKYMGILGEITSVENDNLALRVLMDIDGRKEVISVPRPAFSAKPQHLGDQIEAEYVEGGWIFRVRSRTVNVRALWQLEDHRGQKGARIIGSPLGLTEISRIGNCMATQDEQRPVLHVWNPEADFQHIFTMQCGIRKDTGKIIETERRYADRRVFRWAYQTEIVKLQSGGNIFIGEAKAGAFTESAKGWKVKAAIYRVCDLLSPQLYDLRRCFIPINVGENQKSLSRERDEERSIYYQEWLEEKDYHAVGQIKESIEKARKIVLKELYVPSIISDTVSDVEWINEIPLEPGQKPLVSGRQYNPDEVRVKLKNRDGKYTASINDVEAMLLDGKLVAHFDVMDGCTVDRNFYFAGRDDLGRLRFEWGYGCYFAADIQDITDMQGNLIGNGLFFGDRIDSFMLQADPSGRFNWKARVFLKDIHREIEGKVWQDAEKMIVQLLKIKINNIDGTVKIVEVSVADRGIGRAGKQRERWRLEPISNAYLKKESLENLMSKMGAGTEEMIFAQLNIQDYGRDSGNMEFTYIPLDESDDQLAAKLNNKILCLKAGKITSINTGEGSSQIANDQKLDFYLPDEMPEDCETPHIVVSVMRRNFSLDESKLRVCSRVNPMAYHGNDMLVMLKEADRKKKGVWYGSVLDTPFRSTDKLTEWLGQRNCIITMGILERENQKRKCAEIAPGIICDITEFCGQVKFENGAIASLTLVDGKPQPEVILPGDIQYIPQNGRPVELLLMDGVLKRYVQTMKMDADTARKALLSIGRHFTVAGFPQISMKRPDLLDQMIKMEPPRLGILCKNTQGAPWLKTGGSINAGYLDILKESDMPVLNMISPFGRTVFSSWDQITFKDGKVEDIIKYVQCGVWHCHDRFTAVYREEEQEVQVRALPDGSNYREILVFTDREQRLRYLPDEFERFGMSAREIVENGLPDAFRWYPIAGKTDHSLWIETFPGKILELPRTYLHTGQNKGRLAQLYTDAFAPGDEIWIEEEKVSVGERGRILLMGFRFGARSAFGRGRAFLPVQKVEKDSVWLGGGFWKMIYPMNPEAGLTDERKLAMLDQHNRLSVVKSGEQIMKGDCVFLTLDERGRLCVAGGLNIKVELAYESSWGEMAWLLHALQEDRRRTIEMFEYYLPVTVIWKNEAGTKIVVVYKRQEHQGMEENTILCCNCIGMMRNPDTGRMIVLRSGGYLFCVKEEELIEGPKEKIREHIIKELSKRRTEFFMTRIDGKWKPGLNISEDPDKMEIQMLYPVVRSGGIICRSRKSLSLWWLPLQHTCRVKNVKIEDIWCMLSRRRNRTAKLMEDRTLSLICEQESDRRYRLLDMQGSKDRVIPGIEVEREEKGYYYYLSELYPFGDLLLLKSENREDCSTGMPKRVEILEKEEDSVIVVPQGYRRQSLNLSLWIAQAYREAYCHENGNGCLDCELFREYIPKRFEKYRRVLEKAREDAKVMESERDVSGDWDQLEDRLVYLYELLRRIKAPTKKQNAKIYLKVYAAVREWLYQEGEFLACGFYDRGKNAEDKIYDLLPTISAILLLNRINFQNSVIGKELAVHLTRMLGYASGNSLHQEALLRLWLLGKNRGGVWKRLRRISLGGKAMEDQTGGMESESPEVFDGNLNKSQYTMLIEIAEGVAGRHVEDYEAKIVAESLLYSVGIERDYTEYYEYLIRQNHSCSILAPLGRILAPQKGSCVGINKLHKSQIGTLEWALNCLGREMQPVELLTIPIPVSDRQRESMKEKCGMVMELLSKKIQVENYRIKEMNRDLNSLV